MATSVAGSASRKPKIHISESDYDRIAEIALKMERARPDLVKQVLGEIDRAQLHPDAKMPENVVRLGSEVEFLDESSGATRRVTLVMPQEADIDAGRVSVMTPVGAGLIGLTAGQAINWPTPDGRPRTLRIVSVAAPNGAAAA